MELSRGARAPYWAVGLRRFLKLITLLYTSAAGAKSVSGEPGDGGAGGGWGGRGVKTGHLHSPQAQWGKSPGSSRHARHPGARAETLFNLGRRPQRGVFCHTALICTGGNKPSLYSCALCSTSVQFESLSRPTTALGDVRLTFYFFHCV